MSESMKAVVLARFGGADAFEIRDVPVPPVGPRQVRVRVHASAVNPLDYQIRRGDYAEHVPLPAIIGHDVSGVIEEVGSHVSEFSPGDAVYYTPQIFGGPGSYAEQHVADVDLVGRKLPREGGKAIMAFFNEVGTFCQENQGDEALKAYITPLQQAVGHLQQATMWFMQNAMAKPDNAGAGAHEYMHLFGLVALGYMWAKIAKAANEKTALGNGVGARMDAKLMTGRFFMERLMPETAAHLARISSGADAVMALPEAAF